MFCRSLIPMLSSLPPKKNRKAKVDIQELFFDIELDNQSDKHSNTTFFMALHKFNVAFNHLKL